MVLSVCGDDVCEVAEGEACDNCPSDCGDCPLGDYEIAVIVVIVLLVVVAIISVVGVRFRCGSLFTMVIIVVIIDTVTVVVVRF